MAEVVLDLEELKERVQNDIELLLELFDIFMEDYVMKRELLETSLKTDNFDEIRNVSHSLKGASGNISAKDLREKLLVFEDIGAKNDSSGFEDSLVQLDASYKALTERIAEVKLEEG